MLLLFLKCKHIIFNQYTNIVMKVIFPQESINFDVKCFYKITPLTI
jgi:hypothetical protein